MGDTFIAVKSESPDIGIVLYVKKSKYTKEEKQIPRIINTASIITELLCYVIISLYQNKLKERKIGMAFNHEGYNNLRPVMSEFRFIKMK